jgi:RNA polymerase sigma-70 factor, ECF subfamily
MSLALSPEQERLLVQRLKQRDPDAMMELYDAYSRLVYSIILRAVDNSSIAEEITQEAFLRVWNRVHTFDEQRGNFEGWLVTVARNRAFDYLRSIRNAPDSSGVNLSDLEQSSLFQTADSLAPDRQLAVRAVQEALRSLGHEQRQVIELTHFEGMTQTEIAGQLNKPLGTVKGLVRSALKVLRAALATKDAKSPEAKATQVHTTRENAQ